MNNSKITITIDVSKIDKNKIVSRSFQSKTGETVNLKELKLDIVPLNAPSILKDGDTYQLFKTHFVAEQQTAEEKANKVKSKIIGQGVMFKNKEVKKVEQEEDIMPETEEINSDDLPF